MTNSEFKEMVDQDVQVQIFSSLTDAELKTVSTIKKSRNVDCFITDSEDELDIGKYFKVWFASIRRKTG